MKRSRSVLVGAMFAILGVATLAQASEGGFIMGARVAYNHSYADLDYRYLGRRTYNDGGYGFEAGLAGRYAIVPGQLGFHIGANFIYRQPILTSVFDFREQAVSVPVLFEINPFYYGGLRSYIYEMIFLQIGFQVDYVLSHSAELLGVSVGESVHGIERADVDVSFVLGAVGYISSHLSIDIRGAVGLTRYANNYGLRDRSISQGSLGLSYYF